MSKKAKRKKSSFKSKMLWFIVIVATFALLRQSTLILLVGMLPSLVVKFIDNTDDNIWFKTVFCFNLAGIYPYVIDLYLIHNNSTKAMQAQIADSSMWLMAYGAAAIGYGVLWFCPIIAEFFIRVFRTRKLQNHYKKVNRLHEEWGVGERLD